VIFGWRRPAEYEDFLCFVVFDFCSSYWGYWFKFQKSICAIPPSNRPTQHLRDDASLLARWRGVSPRQGPEECEATGDYNTASKCPSSRSPHTLRRGRATKNLNDGMPEEMVGDRLDMSPEVLREHYYEQSEADKRKLQRQFLNGL